MLSNMEIAAFSKVKLKTKSYGIFEGIIMPKSEYNKEDSIIIKLKNGYNFAIPMSDVENIKLLEEHKRKTEEDNDSGEINDVHIISTGGTISSKVEYETGAVKASFKPEDIFAAIPEIKSEEPFKNYSYSFEVLLQEMSEDLNPHHWKIMAKRILSVSRKVKKGIIIAHGTDTMHYTSAALSYALSGKVNVPVVITGAQRSSDRASSDAFLNFLASIRLILENPSPGVYVVMHGGSGDDYYEVHLGTKVKKMHTSKRDAFKSINANPFATLHYDLKTRKWRVNITDVKSDYFKEVAGGEEFSKDAALIKVYPGMKPEILNAILEKVKGAIIEGTGLGHVCVKGEHSLLRIIEKHAKDKFIGICSQTVYGEVHPYVYKNLRLLHKAGVYHLYDMVCEAAYVKLIYALAHHSKKSEIKEFMFKPIAGEIKAVFQ